MPSNFFATSPNTPQPLLRQQNRRSGRHTDLEVYAIRRMAANLEEPGRSRALHILNKALIHRNLTPPKPNIPLTVPFLAHEDFTKHCQQWLRTTIQQHKHFTIPLHLPSHRLREAAHKNPPLLPAQPPSRSTSSIVTSPTRREFVKPLLT